MMIRRLCAVAAALLIASCGSKPAEKSQKLTFERLDAGDTTGWTKGPTLLRTFNVIRDPAGARCAPAGASICRTAPDSS